MALDPIKDKFSDMRLGELLTYTDQDLDDLCVEFDIKMPYKKRFVTAVHLLQANKSKIKPMKPNNHASNRDTSHLILSLDEENALDCIEERHEAVIDSLTNNQILIDKLKINHKNCKLQINDAFNNMIAKLNNRRVQLIERLNFEGNKKMSIIKNNTQQLMDYKQCIQTAHKDANTIAMDPTIDRKTRKTNVLQIEKNIDAYRTKNDIKLTTTDHFIDDVLRFDCRSETAQTALTFVSHYGKLYVAEIPLPPVLMIHSIGVTFCTIQYQLNPNRNPNGMKPTQWIVEYRSYVESHSMDDTDELDCIGNEDAWIPRAKLYDMKSYTLDWLQPNTQYSVRVCCGNDNGWSEYSETISFTTKDVEGGIDSEILSLKEKKDLLQLIADKLDQDTEGFNHVQNKSSALSFLRGIFGKNMFVNEENVSLKLLYRASRDGFEAAKFHEQCDGISNTIVVIETKENNNVFGGYTKLPWKSPKTFEFGADISSFLFVLRNNTKEKTPQIFDIKSSDIQYAVCHDRKYGPIFGNGYSLCLFDRCNEVNTNYTNPVSYAFGENILNPNQLSGVCNFTVQNYEVFQVHVKCIQ
eukprot:75218_1